MKIISAIVIITTCFTLLFCSGCISQQTAQSPVTQTVTIPPTPGASCHAKPGNPAGSDNGASPEPVEQTVIDNLPQNVTTLPPA